MIFNKIRSFNQQLKLIRPVLKRIISRIQYENNIIRLFHTTFPGSEELPEYPLGVIPFDGITIFPNKCNSKTIVW